MAGKAKELTNGKVFLPDNEKDKVTKSRTIKEMRQMYGDYGGNAMAYKGLQPYFSLHPNEF